MVPPLDQAQKLSPLQNRQLHLEAGQLQGGREVVQPIVIGPLAVLSLGLEAGFAVAGELLFGGPSVLGKRHES
jgi:hypothetical protein